MANKRMFSLNIVDTDAFLEMPQSSQLLYFHIAMRADDEGFVGNPKRIMKMIGSGEDDFKVLVVKKFLIPFDSGVCVIKHWLIHNTIRMDRFNPTTYQKEKSQLVLKENKSYKLLIPSDEIVATIGKPSGNLLATQVKLSEVKLSEVNAPPSGEIVEIIDSFKEVNSSYKRWYANKTQREAIKRIITSYSLGQVKKVIALLPKTNKIAYLPTVTTPVQLEDKWASLEAGLFKIKNKENNKEPKYII